MTAAFTTPTLYPAKHIRIRKRCVTICAASPPPSTAPETANPVKTPVHRRLPLVGYFIDTFLLKISNVELARRYGSVYKSEFLGIPITNITDMEAVAACYKDTEFFRSSGAYPPSVSALLGDNVVFSLDGKQHLEQRKLISPIFSTRLFPDYFISVRDYAQAFWTKVSTQVEKEGTLNMKEPIRDHYLGIILRLTTGGMYAPSSVSPQDQFLLTKERLLEFSDALFTIPFGPKWWNAIKARDELLNSLSELVRDRLKTRADVITALRSEGIDEMTSVGMARVRSGSLDFLTVLVALTSLPTGEELELDEDVMKGLCQTVLQIWFAGDLTQVASTLSCLMEMGFREEVFNRLRHEQDSIIDANNGKTEITLEQVNKEMPLLDSYVNEILRIHPPAAGVFRQTSADTTVCGHKIAAGSTVLLDFQAAQRNETYYPEPDRLKVDRFVVNKDDKERNVPQPPAILSFGAVGGGHFCAGAALAQMSIKVTLSVLLREFDLRVDPMQSREYLTIPDVTPRSGVDIIGCSRRVRAASGRMEKVRR